MIDILVIGNPTLDYIDGKFFSPGGPVTYVNNSLFQMNQSSVTTITSFGEDFSEKNLMNPKNLINFRSKFSYNFRTRYFIAIHTQHALHVIVFNPFLKAHLCFAIFF